VKNLIYCASTLFLLSCGNVMASDNKIKVNVGLKGWQPSLSFTDSGSTITSKNDSFALGLSLTARKDRWSIGANYTPGSFEFERVNFIDSLGDQYEYTPTIERTEKDLYLGYDANNNFTLVAGGKIYNYKLIYQDAYFNGTSVGNVNGDSETYKGTFLGVAGHTQPINNKYLLFFTYSYAKLKAKSSAETLDGPASEIGAVIIPASAKMFFSLSYRMQEYTADGHDGLPKTELKFSGLTLGLNIPL